MQRILIVVALIVNVAALAQGTLMLANIGGGANSPVFEYDGANKVARYTVKAVVYAAMEMSDLYPWDSPSVAPLHAPIVFNANGYFVGPTVTIADMPPGSRPWIRVEVFDVSYNDFVTAYYAGAKCDSAVFQLEVGLGGGEPPMPAPGLVGMPKLKVWAAIPEPSAFTLFGLGLAGLLLFRPR